MEFRHSKAVTEVGPVRDDMGFKCINCYFTAHFGIPISRKEALEEIDLRGGPVLSRPSERMDEQDLQVIQKRLRDLGYIE